MEGTQVKKEDDVTITLRVQKEGTRDFYYTMRRDEPLQKLMIAYCERRKLGDYQFHKDDGSRVQGHQTPYGLELENEDVIDAWELSTGGASFALLNANVYL